MEFGSQIFCYIFLLFSLKDNAKDCFCRLDHLPEERVDLVFPVSEVSALDKVVRLLAPTAGGGVLLEDKRHEYHKRVIPRINESLNGFVSVRNRVVFSSSGLIEGPPSELGLPYVIMIMSKNFTS